MNTTLTIPNKIEKTAPKPTKAQLVEALVEKAKEKFNNRLEEARIKQEAILKNIEEEAIIALSNKMKRPTAYVDYKGEVSLRFEMNEPLFKKLGKQYKNVECNNWFRESDVRKTIKDSLAAPNPLLGNPDVSVALENLLESIMSPNIKAINV